MERDFLGLNSKESLPVVKETGFAKSSGFQWPVPQLMSFDFGQGDKAKRIGHDSSFMHTPTPDAAQIQFPISKPVQFEAVPENQLMNTQLSSGIPSPLSVSSHNGTVQSRSESTSTDELMVYKSTGSPTTPISIVEPPKPANIKGPITATGMMPSVPQARKASLTRFLEKRKERVTTIAAPYEVSKKPLQCTRLESNA